RRPLHAPASSLVWSLSLQNASRLLDFRQKLARGQTPHTPTTGRIAAEHHAFQIQAVNSGNRAIRNVPVRGGRTDTPSSVGEDTSKPLLGIVYVSQWVAGPCRRLRLERLHLLFPKSTFFVLYEYRLCVTINSTLPVLLALFQEKHVLIPA